MMKSVREIAASMLAEVDCNVSLDVAFDEEFAIRVASNSPELIASLKEYFGGFVGKAGDPGLEVLAIEMPAADLELDWTIKQPDPGKSKIKEEYFDFADGRLVRKRLTGVIFAMANDLNLAFGPCLANSNQVINFINNRYIEWQLQHGGLLAHAAGVELNGRGMAIAGFSGMGKSTLALQLMNRGCRFVSNDRLVIRSAGDTGKLEMFGIAKHPRVNPGTVLNNAELAEVMPAEKRKALAAIPPDELWELEQKYDVIIDDVYGEDRFVLRTSLDVIILLNWQRDSRALTAQRVDLQRRRDLLGAIMKQPGLFYRATAGVREEFDEDCYLELLPVAAAFELSGGVNFEKAASFCMRLLQGDRADTEVDSEV